MINMQSPASSARYSHCDSTKNNSSISLMLIENELCPLKLSHRKHPLKLFLPLVLGSSISSNPLGKQAYMSVRQKYLTQMLEVTLQISNPFKYNGLISI